AARPRPPDSPQPYSPSARRVSGVVSSRLPGLARKLAGLAGPHHPTNVAGPTLENLKKKRRNRGPAGSVTGAGIADTKAVPRSLWRDAAGRLTGLEVTMSTIKRSALAAAAFVLALSGWAAAQSANPHRQIPGQTPCGARDDVVKMLKENFGERAMAHGIAHSG